MVGQEHNKGKKEKRGVEICGSQTRRAPKSAHSRQRMSATAVAFFFCVLFCLFRV